MKRITLITIISFLIFSCNKNNSQFINQSQKDSSQKLEEEITSNLIDKYNIIASLDTFKIDYTIQFQKEYKDDLFLIDYFNIQDIYQKDSIIYASIKVGFFPTYYIDFIVSKNDYKTLLKLGPFGSKLDAILVVKINSLNKFRLGITSEYYGDIDDKSSCPIDFENTLNFIGKGKIIEIKILNIDYEKFKH